MSNNTMLCGISFKMPRQSRQLTAIASQIETQTNAQHGTVKASIHYFRQGKVDGMKTLKQFQSAWKSEIEHYARYPFAAGMKLLPAALVERALEVNAQFRPREAEIRNDWVDGEYPAWAASAPDRMGSLYEVGDFPTADDCMARFKCDVVIVPLAESEQWQRISVISPDLAVTMQNTQNEAVERVTREAHARLWADVMAPIQHIVDTLSKDKTKIYESLVGNVIAITDLIPAYNQVHQDQNLTDLAARVKASLSEINMEDLRKSAEARTATLEKAKALVEEFQPYARAFSIDEDGA